MIAPIRALIGTVKRYRRPPVAVGLSYSRLMGGMRLGVGDVYSPVVPKTCSRKFKHEVAETFAQLAPAAFNSILNGEEVAAQLSLYGNKFMLQQLLEDSHEAAPWTPSYGNTRTSGELRRQESSRINSEHRASFTRSIAAGIHETINLLWRPQDPDHPEDVFLRRSGRGLSEPDCEAQDVEHQYAIEDDVPIRAVYQNRDNGASRRDQAPSVVTIEEQVFRPLGSGLH